MDEDIHDPPEVFAVKVLAVLDHLFGFQRLLVVFYEIKSVILKVFVFLIHFHLGDHDLLVDEVLPRLP